MNTTVTNSLQTVLAPDETLNATIAVREIATRLWRLRMKRKLKLETVAREVNISPGILRKVESGHYNFTLDILFRLCEYYQVNPDEVFTGHSVKDTDPRPL